MTIESQEESAKDDGQDLAAYLGSDLYDDDDGDELEGADRGDIIGDEAEAASDDVDDDADAEEKSDDDDDAEAADEDADDSEDSSESEEEESEEEVGEDEEEAPAKPEKKAEKDDDSEERGIPRWRFNEINEARKAAEAKLAALEAQDRAKEEATEEKYDFDVAETEYMELLLDGDTKGALAKRQEIRAAEQAAWKDSAVAEAESSVASRQVQETITAMATEAESLYPVFDSKHEDFDPAVTAKVKAFYNGYLSSPEPDMRTQADAFVAAVADVVALYNLDEKYAAEQAEAEPEPEPEPKPKPKPIKKTEQKLAAQQQQAPSIADVGSGSADAGVANVNIEELSDEELDALPEKTLARLRGDFV